MRAPLSFDRETRATRSLLIPLSPSNHTCSFLNVNEDRIRTEPLLSFGHEPRDQTWDALHPDVREQGKYTPRNVPSQFVLKNTVQWRSRMPGS